MPAAPNPLIFPRNRFSKSPAERKIDPFGRLFYIPTVIVFAAGSISLLLLYDWPRRWLLSGAPILTFCVLLGARNGHRILPFLDLWTFLSILHLFYVIASTSWLLYGIFLILCYEAILITCLFQFQSASNVARKLLRSLVRHVHFVHDTISLFGIPALEIDVEVEGLMVLRGLTLHLSSLTIVAHGVELGLKISDDIELAIQTNQVEVALFRYINISDVFVNVKGGEFEMTFHDLDADTRHPQNGDPLMDKDTPLLRAATFGSDTSLPASPTKIRMTERLTDGHQPTDSSAKAGLQSLTQVPANAETEYYFDMIDWLKETSSINQCRKELRALPSFDDSNLKEVRAAICSRLQKSPSVPHPPERSVRVSTLRHLSSPRQREFMHRLPMLLRLLLCPLSYFHPVRIESVTATSSGKWITSMLDRYLFKQAEGADVLEKGNTKSLQGRIYQWLAEANFAIELVDIESLAQVPLLTDFDINTHFRFGDFLAYRSVSEETVQKEVIRLGGADASFAIPSFLLPHHEHILPEIPSASYMDKLFRDMQEADGQPKTVQAKTKLDQTKRDETNVRLTVHASLPLCVDQEVLDFISAVVKASKVVEMEEDIDTQASESVKFTDFAQTLNRNATAEEKETSGLKSFAKSLNKSARVGMKKAAVGGMVNDRWVSLLASIS